MLTDFENEDIALETLVWQVIPIVPEIPVRFRKYLRDSGNQIVYVYLLRMFDDYQTLVVRDYHRKRKAGALPPALVRPSPARLRAVCLLICEQRFNPDDLRTISTFFGPCSDKATCLEAIDRYGTGRFKALGKFLLGETTKPDEKIIELLAWLIDFTPRPHKFGGTYIINTLEDEDTGQYSSQATNNEPVSSELPKKTIEPKKNAPDPPKDGRKTTPNRGKPLVITGLSVLIICACAIYLLLKSLPNKPQACMFWTVDRFQPIPCSQHPANATVIPMDSEKIARFRKITRPDTISEDALGSIWYAKYNNKYECYTDSGYHPLDTNLRLQLLTDYVLIKHIRPDLQPSATLPSR